MGLPPAALCPECCECPTPTIEWDSRSASKTKCGFPQNTGYPAARYRSRGWTGTTTLTHASPPDCAVDGAFCTRTYAGSNDYDEDCACSGYITSTNSSDSTLCTPDQVVNFSCEESFSWGVEYGVVISSATETTATGDGFCYDQGVFAQRTTGTVTEIKSDEYTTADLLANTLAALPAFDDDWDDTAGSYANTTTDELTRSIRESRYRITFTVPKVGSGTCYKVTWIERFTPAAGSVVDNPRCAIWDGTLLVAGTGLIGDGPDPYFSVPIPSTNGTTTVVDVVAVCRGCGTPC